MWVCVYVCVCVCVGEHACSECAEWSEVKGYYIY